MLLLATAAVVYTITKGCSKEGREKSRVERDRERRREGGKEGGREEGREESSLRSSLSSANPAGTAACHMVSGSSLLSASSLGIHIHGHTHRHTSTQLTLLWCSVLLLPEQKGTGLMGRWVLNTGNCP